MNRDIAIKELAARLEERAETQRKQAENRLKGIATVNLVARDFHAEAAETYDAALARMVMEHITHGFGGNFDFLTPAEVRLAEAAKRKEVGPKESGDAVQATTGREWEPAPTAPTMPFHN